MTLRLISFELCPFVQRAVISLEERGVPYEITYVDLYDKPDWFLKLSPTGKVPVLQVGDAVVFESQVIAEYLDETETPSLHPADPLERAQHRAWIEFSNALSGPGYMLMAATDQETIDGMAAKAKAALLRLEGEFVGPLWGGADFSLVDAAVAPMLQRLHWANTIAPELDLFGATPKMAAWTAQLLARPSVQKSLLPNIEEIRDGFLRDGPGGRGTTWLGSKLAA